MNFKDIVKRILRYNKNAYLKIIEKSFLFIYNAYSGEKRLSGEPRIEHNLQCAYILADLEVDDATISAGLLHDVIKHNKATKKELESEFGKEIAGLVDGVTIMTKLKAGLSLEDADAANLRKLLLASSKDIRVIFIKLADRLHNIRTANSLPREKQIRAAKEALEIYAPIAYRLGISSIKRELEDRAFSLLNPAEYKKIQEFLKKQRKNQDTSIRKTLKTTERLMHENNIPGKVEWRIKHIYSIYKKIVNRDYRIEEIKDIMGIRIITDTVENCYRLLQIIHENWVPIPGAFKDYIAMPKPNGYQSLHTAILAYGNPLEFQIRTKEMHSIAEEGLAAHFGYKGVTHAGDFDKKLAWIRELVEEKPVSSRDFLENVKIDFFSEKIYVFTPKGRLIELPASSTPLDFAYSIHSDLGNTTIGANVNGKFTSLKTELKNGDVVEIISSKNQKPSRDWLKIVKTSNAKSKIRHCLKMQGRLVNTPKQSKQESIEEFTKEFIIIYGVKGAEIKLAMCCNPLPGDSVLGLRASQKKIVVHKTSCPEIEKHSASSAVKAEWKSDFDSKVKFFVDGLDRVGLFAEILNMLASRGYNVEDAHGKVLKGGYCECSFVLSLTNLKEVLDIINRLKKISGVTKVYLEAISEKKKKQR